MSYERRPDRRPGGRTGGGRQDRPGRDRPFGGDRERPQRGGFGGGERPQGGGFGGGERPQRGGFGGDRERPPRPGGFRPRDDDGGMSIRLDPRRLAALKLLAAESNMRPGELVTAWVEERIDAARKGKVTADAGGVTASAFADLQRRVDQLAQRLDAIGAGDMPAPAKPDSGTAGQAEAPAEAPAPRRRGRPPKGASEPGGGEESPGRGPRVAGQRVPLHEEIADVIRERGPMTAAEIADAIAERGRYAAPRSSRPLDAATVNSRVSNPAYRARFTRSDGRIGLA